eukprot:9048547-Alexandrium_andersonii.AAC.1
MARPLRGNHTAGRQTSKRSAESSPMPNSGQQPAGWAVACQWSAQAAGPYNPPRPTAPSGA